MQARIRHVCWHIKDIQHFHAASPHLVLSGIWPLKMSQPFRGCSKSLLCLNSNLPQTFSVSDETTSCFLEKMRKFDVYLSIVYFWFPKIIDFNPNALYVLINFIKSAIHPDFHLSISHVPFTQAKLKMLMFTLSWGKNSAISNHIETSIHLTVLIFPSNLASFSHSDFAIELLMYFADLWDIPQEKGLFLFCCTVHFQYLLCFPEIRT